MLMIYPTGGGLSDFEVAMLPGHDEMPRMQDWSRGSNCMTADVQGTDTPQDASKEVTKTT